MNIKRNTRTLLIPLLIITIITSIIFSPSTGVSADAGTLTVVSKNATEIFCTTARLNAEITDLGGFDSDNVTVSFDYGTTTAYGKTSSAAQDLEDPMKYSTVVSGLDYKEVTYHFRAKATTDGVSYYYGNDLSFTTSRYKIALESINGLPVSTSTYYCNPITISGRAWAYQYPGHIPQYRIQIDWGDGTIETPTDVGVFTESGSDFVLNWTYTHTYPHLWNPESGKTTIILKLFHQSITGEDGAADSTTSAKITVVFIDVPDETTRIYEGRPQNVPVTVIPPEISYLLKYTDRNNGDVYEVLRTTGSGYTGEAPVNTGTYDVFAEITDPLAGASPLNIGSDTGILQINSDNTTTTLVSSLLSPFKFGSSVTFTASVTGNPTSSEPYTAIPTGNLTFKEGLTVIETIDLDNAGKAAYTTSSLAEGEHTITAEYSGDTNFNPSAASLSLRVVSYGSTTSISSSLNPSTYGQLVTFSANVLIDNDTAPDAPPILGTVTFKDGEIMMGSPVILDGSQMASFPTTSLFAGSHSISAIYSGDDNYAASMDLIDEQIVNKTPLTITADNAIKTYGTVKTFDGTTGFTTGQGQLMNGETIDNVTLTSAKAADVTTPVGSYINEIVPSDPQGIDPNNYDVTYIAGTLTVEPVPSPVSGGGGGGGGSTSTTSVIPVPTPTPTPTPILTPEPTSTPTPTLTSTPSITPVIEYMTVDFLGKITQVEIDSNGALKDTLIATSPDGINSIELSAGTIATDNSGEVIKNIQITEVQMPPLSEEQISISKAYDFQPSSINLSQDITITLGYKVDQLPQNIQTPGLAYYITTSGWQNLSAENTLVNGGQISGQVDHFSTYALIANRTPADFSLNNLVINRSVEKYWDDLAFVIRTGQTATITLDVKNNGGLNGTYNADLQMNGEVISVKDITLAAGQNGRLTFNIDNIQPGQNSVQIGTLSTELSGPEVWINWWLILLCIVLVVITIGLPIYLGRKNMIRRRFLSSPTLPR